jgi:hypothetical protein
MRRPSEDSEERDGTARYGRYYWCVKVTKDLCQKGEIYVMADEAKVDRSGALYFLKVWEADEKEPAGRHINLLIAAGQWTAVYAASCLDGSAVAVEHWKGEVER